MDICRLLSRSIKMKYIAKGGIIIALILLAAIILLTLLPGKISKYSSDMGASFLPGVVQRNTFDKITDVSTEMCTGGHFHGPPEVCGASGCLDTLTREPQPPPTLSSSTLSKLNSLKDPRGNPLIKWDKIAVELITTMQWSFGIFGSVGEIGVYDGRLTALMASYMEPTFGERLFVCDIFGDVKHMKIETNEAKKLIFETNMQKFDYSFTHKNEEKRIRLWQNSSMYLSKDVLLQMGIPSFRMYSIDGNHHYPFILNDINHVVCVLRDGGIILMDDVLEKEWHDVTGSIKQYMIVIGENIIKPLMLLGRKLYLCTNAYHTKYLNYLTSDEIKQKLCKVTNERFGAKFTYLIACTK